MPLELWSEGGAYEAYVGRWSRLVAKEFLGWLGPPLDKKWLDVGCGTGSLATATLDAASPKEVVGLDRSEGFVAHARHHVASSRASFHVGDAQSLPWPEHTFDLSVSALALNFIPSPARAVREMVRVLVPGGVAAAYVWDYAGEMQMLRRFWDAAVALDPSAEHLDEGLRFPLCRPGPLMDLFHEAGLRGVAVQAIDVPTLFRDFDDFWSPFLGGQGPAPSYVASLAAGARAKLEDRLRRDLPINPDGSIDLVARAWAVRGTAAGPSHGYELDKGIASAGTMNQTSASAE